MNTHTEVERIVERHYLVTAKVPATTQPADDLKTIVAALTYFDINGTVARHSPATASVEMPKETVRLADGYNGHTALFFVEPVSVDGALVKLRCAEPRRQYMTAWKRKADVDAAVTQQADRHQPATSNLVAAAQALLNAFGGMTPDWLQSQCDALEQAIKQQHRASAIVPVQS